MNSDNDFKLSGALLKFRFICSDHTYLNFMVKFEGEKKRKLLLCIY